jgi:hypothetical protein
MDAVTSVSNIKRCLMAWSPAVIHQWAGSLASNCSLWSMEDQEWVKYDCIWPGPESGEDNLILKEPSRLRSGTWEVKIIVDNKTLLQEQIRIEGNWDYWSRPVLSITVMENEINASFTFGSTTCLFRL